MSLWSEYCILRISQLVGDATTLEEVCAKVGLRVIDRGLGDVAAELHLACSEILVEHQLHGHDRETAIAEAIAHAVLHAVELAAGIELDGLHTEEAEAFAAHLIAALKTVSR